MCEEVLTRWIRRGIAGRILVGILVSGAIVAAPRTAVAADPDVIPPPTPAGVTAEAVGGGGGGDGNNDDLLFDAEAGSVAAFSSSRNASTPSSAARNGSRGLAIRATSAPGYARWGSAALPSVSSHASAQFWVRLNSSRAGESVDLFTVANNRNSRNFDFFVTGDSNRFKWDIFRTAEGVSNFTVETGRWYFIEVQLEFSGENHTASVRIDGVSQGTISSPGFNGTVGSVKVGSFTAKTHSQDYDDLTVRLGDQPLGWISEQPAGPPGGPQSVNVRWDGVVDAGSGLAQYQIWRNGRWYGWAPAGRTSYVDNNPVAGGYYQLRAVDAAGNRSGWSSRAVPANVADTQAPPTPTTVTVTGDAERVTVTWSPVTDAQSGVRGYHVWRNGQWYGWVPNGRTSFVDQDPIAGARYQLRVEDNAGNKSAWSSPVRL